MSSRIFSCALCGYVIYEYENPHSAPWMNQLVFAIIQLGDGEYVSGVMLIPSQGEAIQLGYRAKERSSL